ncbi:MAG: hypothetical protein M3Q81_01870 [bacterium]|nr:hypothetical protein [bacterium]
MNYLRHPLTLLVFIILSGLFSLSLYANIQRNRSSTEQAAVLEQEIDKMTSDVSQLEAVVSQATSAANQEKIVRDQLLRQKPGEYVIQLPEIKSTPMPTPSPSPSPSVLAAWRAVFSR